MERGPHVARHRRAAVSRRSDPRVRPPHKGSPVSYDHAYTNLNAESRRTPPRQRTSIPTPNVRSGTYRPRRPRCRHPPGTTDMELDNCQLGRARSRESPVMRWRRRLWTNGSRLKRLLQTPASSFEARMGDPERASHLHSVEEWAGADLNHRRLRRQIYSQLSTLLQAAT